MPAFVHTVRATNIYEQGEQQTEVYKTNILSIKCKILNSRYNFICLSVIIINILLSTF